MLPKFYRIALKLSAKSAHNKHKMAAVLVKGGAVLTKATNKNTWGAHAEKRALHKATPESCLGTALYIARNSGRISKPCATCLVLIKHLGIRKIIYATWTGEVIIEKI